jgi:hypothetical protein
MSRPAPILRIVAPTGADRPRFSIGDVVRTGGNRYPYYEVIAISGARAWIRDVQYGADHVVPIANLQRTSS